MEGVRVAETYMRLSNSGKLDVNMLEALLLAYANSNAAVDTERIFLELREQSGDNSQVVKEMLEKLHENDKALHDLQETVNKSDVSKPVTTDCTIKPLPLAAKSENNNKERAMFGENLNHYPSKGRSRRDSKSDDGQTLGSRINSCDSIAMSSEGSSDPPTPPSHSARTPRTCSPSSATHQQVVELPSAPFDILSEFCNERSEATAINTTANSNSPALSPTAVRTNSLSGSSSGSNSPNSLKGKAAAQQRKITGLMHNKIRSLLHYDGRWRASSLDRWNDAMKELNNLIHQHGVTPMESTYCVLLKCAPSSQHLVQILNHMDTRTIMNPRLAFTAARSFALFGDLQCAHQLVTLGKNLQTQGEFRNQQSQVPVLPDPQ